MIDRVHHIAFVVENLDTRAEWFESVLQLEPDYCEVIEGEFNLEVLVYNLDDVLIELITPTTDSGWVYDYLEKNGEGFFHIAFGVEDIESVVRQIRDRDVDVDDPVDGVDWLVATLDQEETFVPMQVAEDPDESI